MADRINSAGLALVKKYEGLYLTAYQDAVKVWTIGWGHTGSVDGVPVQKGMVITTAKAESLLEADLKRFWTCTGQTSYVPVAAALNTNQRSALTSFAFNCGANNLKKLCAGRTISEIADAMLLYNRAGGKVLSGLVERRKAERALFLTSEGKELATLRKGEVGGQVKALQKLLGGIKVDGVFGNETRAAVVLFQRSKGLEADGICGARTWEELLISQD